MSDTDFNRTQEAISRVFAYVDSLIEQGCARREAIDFAVLEYGVQRGRLVALLNDRDAGLLGNSGETTRGTLSTPSSATSESTLRKPAHGGYPGVTDPGVIVVPDTFPEEWSA